MIAAHDLQQRWWNLEAKLAERFGKKPDMEAILFLIGMQETGFIKQKITMKHLYFSIITVLIATITFAQDSSFDYSRPGKYHQLLANLEGSWTFKGRRFPLEADSNKVRFDLFGTHVWKSFADGRYFIIDMTFGDEAHKIQMPVQNGKINRARNRYSGNNSQHGESRRHRPKDETSFIHATRFPR